MQGLKIQCATCNKFVAPSYMYQHHQRNHDERKTIHTCNQCGKQFHEKRRLENHRQTLHGYQILLEGDTDKVPVRNVMCDVCDAMFFTADGLQQHMTRQHREDPIRYSCLMCGKSFKNNRMFKQHTTKNHRSIVCEECPTNIGKKFGSKSALRKHKLSKHPKDTEGPKDNEKNTIWERSISIDKNSIWPCTMPQTDYVQKYVDVLYLFEHIWLPSHEFPSLLFNEMIHWQIVLYKVLK